MSRVRFAIPADLREFAGGQERVEVAGIFASLEEALDQLWHCAPGLKSRLVDERGKLRPHVNIFIGNESARFLGGLAATIEPADAGVVDVTILRAVSGG
jgi:molybdopterin converting factor small subunit